MKKIVFSILASFFLFTSCKKEFKTIADYKEIPVIYGFLNPFDSVNYLKINKAFLGDGNALLMAQQYDSINYPVGKLEIWMERTVNGFRLDSVPISVPSVSFYDTTTSIIKSNGIFANPNQLLYKIHYAFPQDNNSRYTLHFKNVESGVTAKATTPLLSKISVSNLSTTHINFSIPYPFLVYHNQAVNGKEYDMILRFHFREINTLTGSQELKYVDWNFPSVVFDLFSESDVSFSVFRNKFYTVVGDALLPIHNVVRRIDSLPGIINPIEFIFMGGTTELFNYNYLNSTNNSLIQERPIFNNIEGGVGIFTSLYRYSIFKNINQASKDTLQTNDHTNDLNFMFD